MATNDGMLEWAYQPDGCQMALIAIKRKLGRIDVHEIKDSVGRATGCFSVTATFNVGAAEAPNASEALHSAKEIGQMWADDVNAEPIATDALEG
jgi:hypothetical protein